MGWSCTQPARHGWRRRSWPSHSSAAASSKSPWRADRRRPSSPRSQARGS